MRKWWRSVAGLVIVLACLAGCSRKDEASFCYGYLAGSHQMRLCCNDEKECHQNVEQAWKQYQNTGFVESFHGRFRDECLNREQLWTLTEARVVVGDYRREYNQVRPHSRLGYESPAAFAARNCPFPAPVGLRPPYAGDGQRTDKNINSTSAKTKPHVDHEQ